MRSTVGEGWLKKFKAGIKSLSAQHRHQHLPTALSYCGKASHDSQLSSPRGEQNAQERNGFIRPRAGRSPTTHRFPAAEIREAASQGTTPLQSGQSFPETTSCRSPKMTSGFRNAKRNKYDRDIM